MQCGRAFKSLENHLKSVLWHAVSEFGLKLMKPGSAISRTTSIIIIVVVVIAAIAASVSYQMLATKSSQSVNLVIATLPIADSVPLFVAYQEGYFAAQGLNVTLDVVASPPLVNSAVEKGSAQLGLNSVAFCATANEAGFPLKFVTPVDMAAYPNGTAQGVYLPNVSPHAIAVLASSGIKNLTDLEGKSIGVNALASSSQTNVEYLLAHYGVNLSSISWTVLPYPSSVAALEQKRVDAIQIIQPFITEMLMANQSGPTAGQFRIIGDDDNYGIPDSGLITGYLGLSSWISAHGDIVNKFIAAYTKGTETTKNNQTLAKQILVNKLGLNSTVASQLYLPVYWDTTVPYISIQKQIDILLQFGALKNKSDNATLLVDPTYFKLGPP